MQSRPSDISLTVGQIAMKSVGSVLLMDRT
jgi:hypothetical protein